mgnify:CR=1 FL=1
MEQWSVTNDGEALGERLVRYAADPLSSLGVVPVEEIILVGQSEEKNICNLLVFDSKKGKQISVFKNVKWRLDNQKLYINYCDFKNAENTSIKIEVYDISENKLDFTRTIQKDTTEYYYELSAWIIEGASDYHPEKAKSPEAIQEKFSTFYKSDFKTDSSQKYALIQDLERMVVFYNENGVHVTSERVLWLPITNQTEYREYYSEPYFYSGVEVQNENIIIRHSLPSEVLAKIDTESGLQVYNDEGNPLYMEIPGKHCSGVWNTKSNTWIIEPIYDEVNFQNNKFVTRDIQYETNPSTNEIISRDEKFLLFDLSGNLISTYDIEDEIGLATKIYDADSSKQIIVGNGDHYLFKDGQCMLINTFGLLFGHNSWAKINFNEGLISGTYNQGHESAINYSNGNFYQHFHIPELGFYKSKVNAPFFGKGPIDVMTRESEWIKAKTKPSSRILSGIENYGDYSIIRNVSETEIMELPYLDEDGYETYDDYGDPMYLYEITKGHYNTGLWDNQNHKWLLQPIYEDIIITKNGFTSQFRQDFYTDWVDYLGLNRTQLDSTTRDYVSYNSSFKVITEFSSSDLPYKNAEYYKYLGPLDPDQKIVQQPFILDSTIELTLGHYYLAAQTNGKYSLFSSDDINQRIDILVSDVDWICETNDMLFYISQDSMYITKTYDFSQQLVFSLPSLNGSDLLVTNEGVVVLNTLYYLSNDPFTRTEPYTKDAKKDLLAKISVTTNKILVVSSARETQDVFGELDYAFSFEYKANRDIVWEKEGANWVYKKDGASIIQTPFGYCVSNNFGSYYNEYNEYFALNSGSAGIYSKNWEIIDIPNYKNFYNVYPLEENSLLHFTNVEDKSCFAVIDNNGSVEKIISGFDVYEINGDQLIFQKYDEYGDQEYDENGDLMEYKYSLK